MKNITPQKSNSLTIDICKFIGAYMVVAIHTTPFEQTDGVISNIYFIFLKCAVPFFFYVIRISVCAAYGVAV